MFLSVFDIFKTGIGPSSSHTVGPMVATARFLAELRALAEAGRVHKLEARLYGSLSLTGRGHGTDRAILMALLGGEPETVDPVALGAQLDAMAPDEPLPVPGFPPLPCEITFDDGPPLPGHANGLRFTAFDATGETLLVRVYYSVGGGFVLDGGELEADRGGTAADRGTRCPYPFHSAAEMLSMGDAANLSVAEMKRANEAVFLDTADLDTGLDRIWAEMAAAIDRGLGAQGCLPGGLKIRRRAGDIAAKLQAQTGDNRQFQHSVMDWISVYAMAVNEENAAGGRIVTAPTNGAAGVVPAVLRYYLDHCPGAKQQDVRCFLLVAAAVAGLIKHNASISGAEVGCQGEVGSASAMAAAGLAAVLGGSNMQVENAAEIALEHHLGMTCDPIDGLVQVPCIERNALGAVKAVTAASLALQGDGTHFVPLDGAIRTMFDTGRDMLAKYKETSQGGLAVNVVEC